MGLVADADRLFVGTESGIREYRNVPNVAARLTPPGRNDAVYALRNHHVTGDIDIHEMALGEYHEVWYVNTRFSCLCTLDQEHSFVPRWRPRFITGLGTGKWIAWGACFVLMTLLRFAGGPKRG